MTGTAAHVKSPYEVLPESCPIETRLAFPCPDCAQPMPAESRYLGEGRWVFQFACQNFLCENFRYQYRGEVHEVDQHQPTSKQIDAAFPATPAVEGSLLDAFSEAARAAGCTAAALARAAGIHPDRLHNGGLREVLALLLDDDEETAYISQLIKHGTAASADVVEG